MNLGQSIKVCLSKYADFSGRASRSEYWWFMLFGVLISCAGASINDTVYGLVCLALLLPHLAVAVRRLHDINHSAWWILLLFIPIANIVIIIWFCMRGTVGSNEYGADTL
jgi:uncharacterized membrane protein YhaH (DUF805 family)